MFEAFFKHLRTRFFILPKSSDLKISKFDFQGFGTSDLFCGFRVIIISHKNPFFSIQNDKMVHL